MSWSETRKVGAGVDGGAVALDQVGLTLKLEGQVIEGGAEGCRKTAMSWWVLPLLRKPPTAGPCRSSIAGFAVDFLDADDAVVEVERPFDVGDEEVGVPEPSSSEEGGLDLGHPVRSSKSPPRISRNMRRAFM